MRRVCRLLGVTRSTLYTSAEPQTNPEARTAPEQSAGIPAGQTVVARIKALAKEHPTFGPGQNEFCPNRRLWALLRFGEKIAINIKRVHRVVKGLGLQVKVRETTPRPRVQEKVSQVNESNKRWATDITHVYCGKDGWGHLAAVVDCCDREIAGFEFALRGRAKEVERALEAACLSRFGTVRPCAEDAPILRSDNGLVFTSKRFKQACAFYRLEQEFITPYTPQQNGMIERFFRSLKEECVWQHNFGSFEEARTAIREWITWYAEESLRAILSNEGRPHQSLGYLSPAQYRQKQALTVV